MAQNLGEDAKMLARLVSLSRNKYFYGKLLTERELTLEQSYMNRKRWLLNRLGLGSGVLCGLEVEVSEDGTCLLIQPGAAIDPLGREIIIPEPYCLQNPRQPTDCQGNPSGDPIKGGGTLYLCLCYRECDSEPVPVMVSECDTHQACAANMVNERYCLRLCTEVPPAVGLGKMCGKIFPAHPKQGFDHRLEVETALGGDCPIPDSECVVLAEVHLPEGTKAPVKVDMYAHRTVIFSNEALFDLLICLADQMAICCLDRKLLVYVSGDAQSAQAGNTLKDPLVVQVVDANHSPIRNEDVTFKVRGGGGQIPGAGASQTVNSDTGGMAKVEWQLGTNAGLNTLEASIASGANVVFAALTQPAIEKGPVILETDPTNGVKLTVPQANRILDLGLGIVFDRNMNPDTLARPDDWLMLWLVRTHKDDKGGVLSITDRIKLVYNDQAHGGPASDVRYQLRDLEQNFPKGLFKQGIRVLVVAMAQHDNIISDPDKVLLDADFDGSQLQFSQTGLYLGDPNLTLMDALLKMAPGDQDKFSDALYNGLSSGGTPPVIPAGGTGDGTPGGLFHIYFAMP